MDHPMLDQIRPSCKFFVTHVTGIWTIAKMEILVLHEDMFVAEPSLADVALVGFLADMGEPDVPDEAILVSKLFLTQRTMECSPFTTGFRYSLDVFCRKVAMGVVVVASFCR